MIKNNNAFTLIELIIVIVILAILGTIAFISLQGYSASTRDSTRLSDLSTIKTSLELYHLDSSKYPLPTNSFDVSYSGSTVWKQGTFGDKTFQNVQKMDRIPIDPLIEVEYTYSLTKNNQEFQLAGILEGDLLTFNNGITNKVNAGNEIMTALVTGNYNGKIVKVNYGNLCEILSIPSIISNQSQSIKDLKTILDNKGLVYNLFNNLPSNYYNSKYTINGGFDFTSGKLIVYSDNNNCKGLYIKDATSRVQLLNNLQVAYNGTIIENIANIKKLESIDINNVKNVNIISKAIVNNVLGGKVTESSFSYKNCNNGNILGNLYGTISYNFNQLDHNSTALGSFTNLTGNGTDKYTGTISCNNGTVSISSENKNITCNTGYSLNGNTCSQNLWVTSNYGSCSVSCGGGTQSRSVQCKDSLGNILNDNDCINTKPTISQSCNVIACYSYSWATSGYGTCSASCGGGTQSRSVQCRRSDGANVSNFYCNSPKPSISQSCNTSICINTCDSTNLGQYNNLGQICSSSSTSQCSSYTTGLWREIWNNYSNGSPDQRIRLRGPYASYSAFRNSVGVSWDYYTSGAADTATITRYGKNYSSGQVCSAYTNVTTYYFN